MRIRSRSRRSISNLEVDAAEGRLQAGDDVDEPVRVGLGKLDVEHVDSREFLEEAGLALHHRLAGERADRAEPEHGGAVGDDRDEVAARRQVVGLARIALDRGAGGGHPGRIGERQVALVGQPLGRQDRDLSRGGQAVIVERALRQGLVHCCRLLAAARLIKI
jgi:hypothetical protein